MTCLYLSPFLFDETSDINPADVAATLKRLPKTLSEAVEALEKDQVLHDLLGQKLVVAINGVRKVQQCLLVFNRFIMLKYIGTNLMYFPIFFNSLRSSIIRRTQMHLSNSFIDTKPSTLLSLGMMIVRSFHFIVHFVSPDESCLQ